MEHSKTPWAFSPQGIPSVIDANGITVTYPLYKACLIANEDGTAAEWTDQPSIANARRIVACVNACHGMPIEVIESMPGTVADLATTCKAFMAQRDYLLAALRTIANSEQIEGDTIVCDFDTLQGVARSAIAKIEGGAA